ncbi:MAG: radical SAM protein, partial [Candidatus Helarchaeota archaeon]|nr:radical SAM protein [Candidatus Helarchaeota archaeon]
MHELEDHYTGDRLFDNLILNKYEFAHGMSVLKSYPWRFSFPFTRCNARCEFCRAWISKEKPISPETIELLIPVIQHCFEIDLVGWGEPLIYPQFESILNILKNNSDPRAKISLTTNGVLLKRWADRLLTSNINDFGISIHAATAQTHHDLMNLGIESFDEIIKGIRYLVEKKKTNPKKITISVIFILMKQNIHEIPQFIKLFNDIGIDHIFIRTLAPRNNLSDIIGLNYHLLPPYLHPDFEKLRKEALAAINESKVPVLASPESWDKPIFPENIEKCITTMPGKTFEERVLEFRNTFTSPETIPNPVPCGELEGEGISNTNTTILSGKAKWIKDLKSKNFLKSLNLKRLNNPDILNPYNRIPPYDCPSPYTAFYIRDSAEVRPCCYIGQIDGYKRMYLKKSDQNSNIKDATDFF